MTETKKVSGSGILKDMIKRHEIADEQWDRIKDLVPPERSGGKGRPAKDNRMMINAIVWIVKTGAPWRDLPERFGSWNSVYSRYSRWTKRGIWENIFLELSKDQDTEEYMIDGSYVRVHQHGTGGKGGTKSKELVVLEVDIPPRSMP
jgi:transposase